MVAMYRGKGNKRTRTLASFYSPTPTLVNSLRQPFVDVNSPIVGYYVYYTEIEWYNVY
jgi:hypothetical protein